jgi:hypothetical protein
VYGGSKLVSETGRGCGSCNPLNSEHPAKARCAV